MVRENFPEKFLCRFSPLGGQRGLRGAKGICTSKKMRRTRKMAQGGGTWQERQRLAVVAVIMTVIQNKPALLALREDGSRQKEGRG